MLALNLLWLTVGEAKFLLIMWDFDRNARYDIVC